jgi:membrane associated rhomboid family serine protease
MAEIGIGGQRTDAMSDDAESPVRVAPSRRVAEEWALVLATAGIEARMQPEDGRWVVSVPDAQAERAAVTLAAYDGDRAHADDEPEPPQSEAGVVLSAVIVAIYAATGPRHAWTEAFRRGSAVGERIVAGEWWRAVTALTLHADAAHILGNAFIGLLFTTPVCRFLGPGFGAALILATGVVGNLIAAAVRRTASTSVGASTAIFGAVGILCGRAVVRAVRRRTTGRRPWIPLAAGLALLALLGTSERADLLAHATGFVVGLPLGAMTAGTPRPGRLAQAVLAAASALLVAGSWWLALR